MKQGDMLYAQIYSWNRTYHKVKYVREITDEEARQGYRRGWMVEVETGIECWVLPVHTTTELADTDFVIVNKARQGVLEVKIGNKLISTNKIQSNNGVRGFEVVRSVDNVLYLRYFSGIVEEVVLPYPVCFNDYTRYVVINEEMKSPEKI